MIGVERMDGISLPPGPVWEVTQPRDSAAFFRELPTLFPSSAVLCIEGHPDDDVMAYLATRAAERLTIVR